MQHVKGHIRNGKPVRPYTRRGPAAGGATLGAIVLVAAFLHLGQSKATDSPQSSTTDVTVQRIIDGDTITARVGRSTQRVRLIGIAAPEPAHDGHPAQCGADFAAERLRYFLGQPHLTLIPDPKIGNKDRYGRLLRYITVTNPAPGKRGPLDVGARLLQDGAVKAYSPSSTTQPSKYPYYVNLQEIAQSHNIGLWKCK